MEAPLQTLRRALKRSRTPWNWCVQRASLALLLLSLGLRSPLLFATAVIGLGASLFELHLPQMELRAVWKLMRLERDWLDAGWTHRKRAQAAILGLMLALLLWSLAVRDVLLLLLAASVVTLVWVESSHRRTMDWAERDDAERLASLRRAEEMEREQELLDRETQGPEQ